MLGTSPAISQHDVGGGQQWPMLNNERWFHVILISRIMSELPEQEIIKFVSKNNLILCLFHCDLLGEETKTF